MPKFVPVTDQEAPKSEQNLFSAENLKHRKFDNPHAVVKAKNPSGEIKRGWEYGNGQLQKGKYFLNFHTLCSIIT